MVTTLVRFLSRISLLTALTIYAGGQSPAPGGLWSFGVDDKTLVVLQITNSGNSGLQFAGSITQPPSYQTSNSVQFTQVSGTPITSPLTAIQLKDNDLYFTVVNGSDKDDYSFHTVDSTHATLQLRGFPIPPMLLSRATPNVKVSVNWDPSRTYTHVDSSSPNARLKQLFDEDQALRKHTPIDWQMVSRVDAQHRVEVDALLRGGLINTGLDFFEASVIFQHGLSPEDFLVAHTLALISVDKGNHEAVWEAAASLDRYLQSIAKPQIYGTQFSIQQGSGTTQAPFNTLLVPDILRMQLGVPTIAEQILQGGRFTSQTQRTP